MVKRILGIVLAVAVVVITVMAVLEKRKRDYPMIDSPVIEPTLLLPDTTGHAPSAGLPDSL